MKARIWSTSIWSFLYVILVTWHVPQAFPWGSNAHERITDAACELLPSEVGPFFVKHRGELAHHSNDPDRWRRKLLFRIGLKYENDLNSGKITEDLRGVFEAHGIVFPRNAPVSLNGKDGRWLLTINEQKYPIRKEADKLYLLGVNTGIFENRNAKPVLIGADEGTSFALDPKEKLLSLTSLNVYKSGDPAESPRHYLDIDMYGPYPFEVLPHSYDDAVAKFDVETVTKRGLATWRIDEYTRLLSDAMKSGEAEKIVQIAGALAHYVEDIHMPLHVVENYNGQLTNQYGVHQRFEIDMVDTFAEQIHLEPKVATALENPLEYAFDIVLDSYVYADNLLHADRKAKSDEDTYGASYLEKLFRFSGWIAEQRMSDAATATAGYWYTAWVRAGKPALK